MIKIFVYYIFLTTIKRFSRKIFLSLFITQIFDFIFINWFSNFYFKTIINLSFFIQKTPIIVIIISNSFTIH